MAWRCSGGTNRQLISNMADSRIITQDVVVEAMNKVDRANFVTNKADAYEDSPQPIGFGATISAPHMHAYAVEHLLPYLKPGARVLDIGSGSGYLTAIFHHMVTTPDVRGKVIGIEHVPELVEWSKSNLRKDGLEKALDSKQIEIFTGDGRQGYASGSPYDAIHVGAAAPTLPEALVSQLASPGRMFIPVGTHDQQILHVDKDVHGQISKAKIMSVRYVPLTEREKQM